jgi:phage shock protein PspC (stress-responsive transcriptional regulator)
MVKRLRAFLAFCYDFVIGDDWRIAVGVVAGLALTYAVSQSSVPAWWLLPVLLVLLLPASLWLAVRASPGGRPPRPPA